MATTITTTTTTTTNNTNNTTTATTTTTTTTAPGSCTSSTGTRGPPAPAALASGKRSLSDAGRTRVSSFPSRQRRMGPAPLASFEDLSMDKTTSDSSPEERNQLPEIGEETSGATTPVTPVSAAGLAVPASPRIRVSAASSSSPHETDSKESTPEKELFSGYAKSDYCENMAADLHSSTEELDADEEEQQRRRRERATKLAELERREEALRVAELNRKGSSSSVISDGLLPVTSGHSSRLSSLGSIGSARRSPSPHRMLLETSFCGNRPIQQPSIDLEDPPVSTTRIMDFAIDSIEQVKSPMEARPPDIFRSPATSPRPRPEDVSATEAVLITKVEVPVVRSAPPPATVVASVAKEKKPEKKPFPPHVEVNAKEDLHISTAIPEPPKEPKSTHPPKSPSRTEQLPDQEQQQRQPLSSQSSPRSPRMPKKVPVPQVPDLKDLTRSSPAPSVTSSAASTTTTTPEYQNARSFSTTPTASPGTSRRRRTRDEVESGSSSPSVSRKSSFTNLFRKSDNAALSPVTPDSPGSSGRKSPFSQFIRSAKKEFRSRSRSRSRSKSRERDLEDDTHDRRTVLSIFKPKTKKKSDAEKGKVAADTRTTSTDSKISEAITNVEFTFNDEGKYQPSTFGLIRQESEVNRAIKEMVPVTTTTPVEEETPRTDAIASSRDSSYNELSSIMNTGEAKPSGEKTVAEGIKENGLTEKRDVMEDEVFDKPREPSPAPPKEIKENEIKVSQIEKPSLPPKQRDRAGDAEAALEPPTQDQAADLDSRSESERESEIEYLKNKARQQQGNEGELESPDVENKGLVSQDSIEDGELPYVPTTLPMERPLAAPMIPVKERFIKMQPTHSIDRPRSTTPLLPGRLEEYKTVSRTPEGESDRMMISIPQTGPVKVLPTRSPKRQSSKSWEDFCQEGLRSPRTLRKQFMQKTKHVSDDKPPPLPPKVRSPSRSPVAPPDSAGSLDASPTVGPQPDQVKSWINFDEMPDVVLKPVRQIKTVPPRHPSQQRQKDTPDQREAQPQLVREEQRVQQEKTHEKEVAPARKLPPSFSQPFSQQGVDSDIGQAPHSEASTPDKADSSDRSSDSDKPTSPSSSEDLTTVRERLEEIKKEGKDGDDYENSDLERLLAPVNDCINRLSSLSSEPAMMERRSPIPDNWADFLLPPQPGRRSRLSSLGSDAGSMGGRSPSPSCMLLETSFCGSHPIDDPAAAEPDVPIAVARKLSGISLGDLSPFPTSDRRDSSNLLTCPDRTSLLSDSSAEGGGSPRECEYYGGGGGGGGRHPQQQDLQRGQQGSRQLNPFGMDLGVRSNRSSLVSQDQSPPDSPNSAAFHPS